MISSDGQKLATCPFQLLPVRDALDLLNGKWKIPILLSIMQGARRFGEIERSMPKITAKVLAKELKDLEEHQLNRRIVHHDESPVLIEYTATEYARSLENVLTELHAWGANHRKKILGK